MKYRETLSLRIVFSALFALTLLPGVAVFAMEDTPAIIHDNALLKAVYEKEAATGLWFAGEIRALLVAARRGKGPNSGGESPRFRGGARGCHGAAGRSRERDGAPKQNGVRGKPGA